MIGLGRMPGRTGVLALVVCLLVLGANGSSSAKPKLPKWATEAIEAYGQLPVFYEDEADAENLFVEQIDTYGGEDAVEKSIERRVIRILTPDGVQYGQNLGFSFDGQSEIVSTHAWTLKPDGKIVELEDKEITEIQLYPYKTYVDTKVRTFSMPEIAPGDIVVYEVETHRDHPIWSMGYSGTFDIMDRTWRLSSYNVRFTLNLSPLWSYQHKIYYADSQQPEMIEEGSHTWNWDSVKGPYKDELNITRKPQLAYNCTTTDPEWFDRNRATWEDLASHYQNLSNGRLGLNAELREIVTGLTADKATNLEKIRAIANFVRQNITYLAVEVGVGGYQPRHVLNTFRNRYGDCKDMSSMVVSMLGAGGITAYPALIRTTDRGFIDPEFPMQTFNHVIAYIPNVEETEVWVRAFPAGPDYGRSLWIDATANSASIEDMPGGIQGTHALVVTPEEGYLLKTPVLGPEQNAVYKSGFVELQLNGDSGVTANELFVGADGMDRRSMLLRQTEHDRLEWMQRYLGARVARSQLIDFQLSELDNLDEHVQVSYEFSTRKYANIAGNLFFFRPNIFSARSNIPFTVDERQYGITFTNASSEIDSVTFSLPEIYVVDSLPESMSFDSDFGAYRTSYTVKDNKLEFRRHFSIKLPEVPADSYQDLIAFYQMVIRSDKAQVVLKKRPLSTSP